MKAALTCALLSALASGILAASLPYLPDGQAVMGGPDMVVPQGFDIDLSAKRLVQFAHDEKPVWITEYDKVCRLWSSCGLEVVRI